MGKKNINVPTEDPKGEENVAGEVPETHTVKPKSKEVDKVEVPKDVLERLLDTVEKQGEQIKDLTSAADIGRLNRIQSARSEGKLIKNSKLYVYDGKVVLGWAKTKDDVYFDEAGRLHEDQQIELYLDDGDIKNPLKTPAMPYRTFSRLATKVEGEVISETRDKEGRLFYKVQLEDGREYELAIVFLN